MSDTPVRNVIITGGNSGIGRATAEAFVKTNAQVAIIGRNRERLLDTAQTLGAGVVWQQADVSKREQVVRAVNTIVERFGTIDVLVNVAGFVEGVTTNMQIEEAEENWDRVLDANLKGSFLMIMAVAPHMRRPGGRIINISSIAAFTGGSRAGSTAYAAAKAGVLGLTYGFAR